MRLYHGTTEAIARVIIETDCGLIPGATKPVIANPAFVYMTRCSAAALGFGYGRVMGKMQKGEFIIQPFVHALRNTYDRVAVFQIDSDALDKSLMRESDRDSGFVDSAYESIVPAHALTGVAFMRASKRMLKIATLLFKGPMDRPMDLTGLNRKLKGVQVEHFALEAASYPQRASIGTASPASTIRQHKAHV